jgi:hypothetical protein
LSFGAVPRYPSNLDVSKLGSTVASTSTATKTTKSDRATPLCIVHWFRKFSQAVKALQRKVASQMTLRACGQTTTSSVTMATMKNMRILMKIMPSMHMIANQTTKR